MRDPPYGVAVSETFVGRREHASLRAAEVGLAPRELRAQESEDNPAPDREKAADRFVERLLTVLYRALAIWPI